jgi:excisionase family DNA binding protein
MISGGRPLSKKGGGKKMANNSQIEKWSSMDTITDYLDVSRETVLQWINNRNMPAHKVGRLWKFKISEIDEWIKSGGASMMNKADDTTKEDETNG